MGGICPWCATPYPKQSVEADEPHEDAYAFRVASMMTRLKAVPDVETKAFGDLQGLTVGRHRREMPVSFLEGRVT